MNKFNSLNSDFEWFIFIIISIKYIVGNYLSYLPDLTEAPMTFSASLKPSADPRAIDVMDLPVCATKSSTRLLTS